MDGIYYYLFLEKLRKKLSSDRTVAIAAPASFWYLKQFPIMLISLVVDYIVFMTYDLHGQWDYGNPNSFDSCSSGKCIRSHVNITETFSSLVMITKAGVPNNKIMVGEASYGRTFHMARDGCYTPMCEFTGSRTQSDAAPGRCTKTRGYLSMAEINEYLREEGSATLQRDEASDTDIMLYKGDYIAYMTPSTKTTRREIWKALSFGGSIDWALDLQAFSNYDMDTPPEIPQNNACIAGESLIVDASDLCDFTCTYGFCPESLCICTETGDPLPLPKVVRYGPMSAIDNNNVDLNRLCKFACKYGYCPKDVCVPIVQEIDESSDVLDPNTLNLHEVVAWENMQICQIFRSSRADLASVGQKQCQNFCKEQIEAAAAEGRLTNYGCAGFWPGKNGIPWTKGFGQPVESAAGKCLCDNEFVNEVATFVLDALPAIAQVGCYLLMSSLKLVLDIGETVFTGGAGKAVHADTIEYAVNTVNYVYNKDQDPAGAFEWWLSPCGDTSLVPDDVKRAFDIASAATGNLGNYKPPRGLLRGSGRKGDDGNPTRGTAPRPLRPKPRPTKQCKIAPAQATERLGPARNTVRVRTCSGQVTRTTDYVVTSATYAGGALPAVTSATCRENWKQACMHYSSAIRQNPQWKTLDCPQRAAYTKAERLDAEATAVWAGQHKHKDWKVQGLKSPTFCQRDEYPPIYLLDEFDSAYVYSGVNSSGQLVRWLPRSQNSGGGSMWKGVCLKVPLDAMSEQSIVTQVQRAANKRVVNKGQPTETVLAGITSQRYGRFTIGRYEHWVKPNDGLNDNPCWPSAIAAQDPGLALLLYDPYYKGLKAPYDYNKPYVKGSNGS